MTLHEILRKVLESRQSRLEEAGIQLKDQLWDLDRVRQASDERVGEAVGHLLDTAVRSLAQRSERRIAFRTRSVNEGAIIEIEFPGGDLPEASPTELYGAYHSGEDRHALGLVRCRQILAGCGGRAYIGSGPRNAIRYVIEVPRRIPNDVRGERSLPAAGPAFRPSPSRNIGR